MRSRISTKCEAFALLRGFLQGAHASPEQCKVMMNTLAEALELKTVGRVKAIQPILDRIKQIEVEVVSVAESASVALEYTSSGGNRAHCDWTGCRS